MQGAEVGGGLRGPAHLRVARGQQAGTPSLIILIMLAAPAGIPYRQGDPCPTPPAQPSANTARPIPNGPAAPEASPPNTMETRMTAGPIASAAEVEGAAAPTAIPSAWLLKLSRVRMPTKRAKLQWGGGRGGGRERKGGLAVRQSCRGEAFEGVIGGEARWKENKTCTACTGFGWEGGKGCARGQVLGCV